MSEKLTRIAIVEADKCKPKKCRQECKKGIYHSLEAVRSSGWVCLARLTLGSSTLTPGKLCIEVETTSKIAFLSEVLCIGCGICVKKCPFEAITVINLPTNLDKEQTHRYVTYIFVLCRASNINFLSINNAI
jgi:ATP-binding cassette subfamily E protein 1